MRHTYYTDYVSYAIRSYAQNQDKRGAMDFDSEAEMLNWNTCAKTMLAFDANEREILLEIYAQEDNFQSAIYLASMKREIPIKRIWALVDSFAKQFAKNRGLI